MRREGEGNEERADVGVGDVGLSVAWGGRVGRGGEKFVIEDKTGFESVGRPRLTGT